MATSPPRRRPKTSPSGETGEEALYLRFLSEKQIPVHVRLRDGEVVHGWIEYFDESMIRLTREGKPNLFIYKAQIRTISEPVRREESRQRTAARKGARALLQAPNGHAVVQAAPAGDHAAEVSNCPEASGPAPEASGPAPEASGPAKESAQ